MTTNCTKMLNSLVTYAITMTKDVKDIFRYKTNVMQDELLDDTTLLNCPGTVCVLKN